MARNKVGDIVLHYLQEAGTISVTSRDGLLGDAGIEAGVKLYKHLKSHPISYMTVASDWLERDDRFEKSLIHGHDLKGNPCILRCFTLRKED